jgi:iron complex transport system ATP-binding protein
VNNLFETTALSFRYPGAATDALSGVSVSIPASEFCAFIGPNGSGKSTLLKLLVGLLKPTGGSAQYRGQPAHEWDRRALARQVGVVTQIEELMFPFTVRELVAMGRYPHLGAWQSERAVDREAIERALERCDVTSLLERTVQQLSGGERQRVRIARALAQEPAVLILDEPTASLDVGHEMALFELMAELCTRDGATVIAATHNINLAARYAQRMVLLAGGSAISSGTPKDVLTREQIEKVYEWPVVVGEHPGPGRDAGAVQIIPLAGA